MPLVGLAYDKIELTWYKFAALNNDVRAAVRNVSYMTLDGWKF